MKLNFQNSLKINLVFQTNLKWQKKSKMFYKKKANYRCLLGITSTLKIVKIFIIKKISESILSISLLLRNFEILHKTHCSIG